MTDILAARAVFAKTISHATIPDQVFAALHQLSDTITGARLFTIMTVDMEQNLAKRAYSSDPDRYPVSGTKPITRDSWFEGVHDRHETFVANTLADIAKVFPDFELIGQLGCGSVINLPVVQKGSLVATVNILDAEQFWTEERIDLVQTELQIPAITAMATTELLAHYLYLN